MNRITLFAIIAILAEQSLCMRVTRVRILRSDQEKLRYLNKSKYMRENLFFGMRPILYIQKYQNCDCGTSVGGGGGPPSGSNTQLDPPVFPDDDDIVPPAEPNNAAIVVSTVKTSTSTTPSTVDNRGQEGHNNRDTYGNQGDQEEEEEFELLLSNNGEEAHIVDEGYNPSSPHGSSIRVGGGLDGFPNDPFARPFLLTIRANSKNRRQNNQQKGGGGRTRRRRPSSPSTPNVSRQLHGPLSHGPLGHLSHQSGSVGGQFLVPSSQQGANMFNGPSTDGSSFVPLSAFIIPPQTQNVLNVQQSLYEQQQQQHHQQQLYQQQQQQNYQRQLQMAQSNQHDHLTQPPLNPGFGHININTNERKQG